MRAEPAAGSRRGWGEIAFRWRSYLPLAAVLGLVVGLSRQQAPDPRWIRLSVVAGLSLAAIGLLIRGYAVGHAPPGTSGRHRRQHAAELNTFGIYSALRHPLYLGNVLVWIGVSLTSGWALGTALSALLAILLFGSIVRHEDDFLSRQFGNQFAEWAAATPAFLPRFDLWRTARTAFRWPRAVASEYSTLHSIGLLALIFAAVRSWTGEGGQAPGFVWWVLFGLNSATYLGVRAWRSRLDGVS